MTKKIKYEKRNIFPYGEVLVPTKELETLEKHKRFIEKYFCSRKYVK